MAVGDEEIFVAVEIPIEKSRAPGKVGERRAAQFRGGRPVGKEAPALVLVEQIGRAVARHIEVSIAVEVIVGENCPQFAGPIRHQPDLRTDFGKVVAIVAVEDIGLVRIGPRCAVDPHRVLAETGPVRIRAAVEIIGHENI